MNFSTSIVHYFTAIHTYVHGNIKNDTVYCHIVLICYIDPGFSLFRIEITSVNNNIESLKVFFGLVDDAI